MLLLHQCRDEVVAGVGSAPTSADFQPAAHLSEPSSVWKMVPRRGVAPRSPAYRAGALLLSYGGMKSGSAVSAEFHDAVQRTAPHS